MPIALRICVDGFYSSMNAQAKIVCSHMFVNRLTLYYSRIQFIGSINHRRVHCILVRSLFSSVCELAYFDDICRASSSVVVYSIVIGYVSYVNYIIEIFYWQFSSGDSVKGFHFSVLRPSCLSSSALHFFFLVFLTSDTDDGKQWSQMSNDETSLLAVTNNIYVFSFSSVCVRVSIFLPLSLYLYSSRRKETRDVDIFSMSVRSNRSCSTQLSCQHPTQHRLCACRRRRFSSRFFYLSSLSDSVCSSLGSALARCWLIAVTTATPNSRLTLKSVCLMHLVFHSPLRLGVLTKNRARRRNEEEGENFICPFFFFVVFLPPLYFSLQLPP